MKEYKIFLLGTPKTGKSSLVLQFVQGTFSFSYDPTIEDVYKKTIEVDGEACNLVIKDQGGKTEEINGINLNDWERGEGFIFVYSLTDRSSFENLNLLRNKIIQIKNSDQFSLVLVGNKYDLGHERIVVREEGDRLSREWSCTFLETSAKDKIHVQEIFYDVIRQINRERDKKKEIETNNKKKNCVLI